MSEDPSDETIREELTQRENLSLVARIAGNPRPLAKWGLPMLVLILVEFGTYSSLFVGAVDSFVLAATALLDVLIGPVAPGIEDQIVGFQQTVVGYLRTLGGYTNNIPTLFSREVIPNQGYQTGPNSGWKGTFLGLPPAYAWALRLLLTVGYFIFTLYWVFRGWLVYRDHYREADWTPTDNIVKRFRGHRWGQFGLLVVALYLTMVVFGSGLAPTTVQENVISPYEYNNTYYDHEYDVLVDKPVPQIEAETGRDFPSNVSFNQGTQNFNTKSKGAGKQNVGPFSYDRYGRYHPFGTDNFGQDLFTFLIGGARLTLIVTFLGIFGASLIAAMLSMLSAYYSGSVDLFVLTTADGVISIPQLLLLLMVSVVFADHWFGQILSGGFLISCVFALTTWPFLWRAVRGPALQVAQEEWITAAKSYGQKPRKIMRKHMFPYVVGYLLVYASMSAGGMIILLSALSFIGGGLGINPPIPAWGRAINNGQPYVSGPSWHISLISGMMIVVLVTGLNALGDGIRDAIDPESAGGEGEEAAAGGGA